MRITRYPTQSLDRTFLYSSLVQVALVIAVIVALLAVSLPARIASAAQSGASAAQMEVVIVPPRITIALGDDGALQSVTTSVFIGGTATPVSISAKDLAALGAFGIPVPALGLDAMTTGLLTGAGVEHLQVVKGVDGMIDIYVNGAYTIGVNLGEDQANYERVLALVEGFTGIGIPLKDVVVPVVLASGGDVVITIGESTIPVREEGAPSGYVGTEQQEIELMAKASVSYDADGNLSVLGMSAADLGVVGTELAPAIIALMTNNGISELNVKINNDGLSLGSNGEMLADVRLGDADALGILTAFAPQASMVLPYLHLRDRIDVDLTVSLP
ncbi:MAG: hypothetical protein OXQ27_12370 [Chloroflexota bacterium]|nr:hypothetical protein [Chloroflexota bacterium]